MFVNAEIKEARLQENMATPSRQTSRGKTI